MTESKNRIVQNAMDAVAANMPCGRNLYKCPYCGSTNGWTYDGHCKSKRCGRILPPDMMGKFATERIKRGSAWFLPRDVRGVAWHRETGPIDVGVKAQKHIHKKHPESEHRTGMTVGAGKFGKTTVGSVPGRPVAGKRMSGTHGSQVAFVEKDGGRSSLKSHFTGGAAARREGKLHKETRRK